MAVCKNTDTYSFWSGVEKCTQSVTRMSQGQLARGAAGPRHLENARSHLQPQTGMEKTTSCWCKVLPWGPTAFQKFRDLLIFIYSNSTHQSLRHRESQLSPSLTTSLEAGTINSSVLQIRELRLRGCRDSPKVTKTISSRTGIQTEPSLKYGKMHKC